MITANPRNLIILGVIVAAAALGAVGWVRVRDRGVGNPYPAAIISSERSYPDAAPQLGTLTSQPAYYPSQPSPQPGYVVQPPPVYESDGYYPSRMRPIYVRQNAPIEEVAPAPAPERVVYRTEYYSDSHGRRHQRSKAHSVAIVAGTAAAGAAIGAIAGGGPGAAIGAISGGGAGFIYDRLTHKH